MRKYGWVPDLPDHRDLKLTTPVSAMAELPASVDLRPQCPPVFNQGQLGSCTANAIGAAIEFDQMKESLPTFNPSRLFIYFNERDCEGTVASDAGAMIRDGIKTVARFGAPDEQIWPYIEDKFAERPDDSVYTAAASHLVTKYQSVPQTENDIKACLASGYPVVFGFSVYESFESDAVAKTGIAPMPATSEAQLGGHAVLMVGYNDETQRFIVRNSWGTGWGQQGYFELPYAYVTNPDLADDFWAINVVE